MSKFLILLSFIMSFPTFATSMQVIDQTPTPSREFLWLTNDLYKQMDYDSSSILLSFVIPASLIDEDKKDGINFEMLKDQSYTPAEINLFKQDLTIIKTHFSQVVVNPAMKRELIIKQINDMRLSTVTREILGLI